MSAELEGCVMPFIYFLNRLQLRYNCANFHHCGIYVIDFQLGWAFLPSVSTPKNVHSEQGYYGLLRYDFNNSHYDILSKLFLDKHVLLKKYLKINHANFMEKLLKSGTMKKSNSVIENILILPPPTPPRQKKKKRRRIK